MSKIENVLRETTLQQVELEPVVHVHKTDSVRSTIEAINKNLVRTAIVTEDRKPLGILTQRNILQQTALKDVDLDQPVEKIMSPIPGELTLRSTLREAIDLLNQQKRAMPIIDDSGEAIGVVTSRTLVNYIASHFSATVYNLPPDPHQTSSSQEGA